MNWIDVLSIIGVGAISSLLWRIRGGLWKDKVPANKIWWAVFMALVCWFYLGVNLLVGFIAFYTSHQMFGWGVYIGHLVNPNSPVDPEKDRENELIDDLLYSARISHNGKSVYLYENPWLFGFCGTALTGLCMAFLWGLYLNSLLVMFVGLSMAPFYACGSLAEKVWPLGKAGWNWGEWLWGGFIGGALCYIISSLLA